MLHGVDAGRQRLHVLAPRNELDELLGALDRQRGVAFEERLVNDGNGGLCTSRRISPYMMAAAGMPLTNLPPGYYMTTDGDQRPKNLPSFSTVSDWKAA